MNLADLNRWTSYAAFALGMSQLFFVVNFFRGVFAGEAAEVNPWEVGTLEWMLPSPPHHHNFDEIPVVLRGPHELSDPVVLARTGRDWVGQAETGDTSVRNSEAGEGTGSPVGAELAAAGGE